MPDSSSCNRWVLRPLQVRGLSENIGLESDTVTIGRDLGNEVVIPADDYPYVSRSHARIRIIDDTPAVEDLGSRNGTLINGKAVDGEEPLSHGDVVQLGNLGPRFAIVCSANLNDTVPALRETVTATPDPMRQTQVRRIKHALGIPRGQDVSAMIQRRGNRTLRITLAAVALVALGAAATFWIVRGITQAETRELRELNDNLQRQLARAEGRFADQRTAWRAERTRLEGQRTAQADRLKKLEADAGASQNEVKRLREQLGETRDQLEKFDPINLEQSRLREVASVAEAVVYIEVAMYLKDKKTGKRLFAERTERGIKLNKEGKGKPYSSESSGSGFAVGADGYILTNSHVARPAVARGWPDDDLIPDVELAVVFSGESRRHTAKLVKEIYRDNEDMALIKIEPFPKMPHVPGIDLDAPPPERGTEVYLCGFPLGKMVLQPDDVVIASTFKGILSRNVGAFLQVDAALYPGNSGGPVIDASGRVIGVATRVQKTQDRRYTPTIGYLIPIGAFRGVWPPD